MAVLMGIVLLLAAVAGFASGMWFLIIAFQKCFAWGLGCLLLPLPVGLIFTFQEWNEVRIPTLISLVAMLVSVLANQAIGA